MFIKEIFSGGSLKKLPPGQGDGWTDGQKCHGYIVLKHN